MRTALVITAVTALGDAWGGALTGAGWTVVRAPSVTVAFGARGRAVDLMVVDAEPRDQRALLSRLCMSFELPPMVLRTCSPSPDLMSWGTAASVHVGELAGESLVDAADAAAWFGPGAVVSLPLRLPSVGLLKWTTRLRAA
ncbi:MAG: hypothetical protein H6709_24785 [Kofleriaceae bacterium]|nr:hypothetical protein [Myxococcales bacterium]MCB9561790.1 hypothetical protein [Kofleriaceae bacterium]MCB9575305.1 hypothetical protein [Kofleriaceae bacterium]